MYVLLIITYANYYSIIKWYTLQPAINIIFQLKITKKLAINIKSSYKRIKNNNRITDNQKFNMPFKYRRMVFDLVQISL